MTLSLNLQDVFTKVNGKAKKDKEKENNGGLIVVITKDIGLMI